MTSGQIVGKMDSQKQLNVPLDAAQPIALENEAEVNFLLDRLWEQYDFPNRLRSVDLNKEGVFEEAGNRPNTDWQEQIHGGILRESQEYF